MSCECADPRAIANYVINLTKELEVEITQMGVIKVVYFLSGWSLAQERGVCSSVNFEAWTYGPVIPILYRELKRFGSKAVEGQLKWFKAAEGREVCESWQPNPRDAAWAEQIVKFYSTKAAFVLSDMSHESDGPWDKAVQVDGVNVGMIVEFSEMKAHFENKLSRSKSMN